MIQCQLKLKLRPAQERMLVRWLRHLTAVYNWAIRTIEAGADSGIYLSRYDVRNKLIGHSQRMGIPAKAIEATVFVAHDAWKRCFKRLSGKPRLKGRRNRLNSIGLTERRWTVLANGRINVPMFGRLKFHEQDIPAGRIKCGRIVRRASGWYLCLFIEAEPRQVEAVDAGEVGIDPGFSSLLTLSTGEKIEHPKELHQTAGRLAQAQRGINRRLVARLKEHESNQRRDRNHKLSRRLVAENEAIYWSRDSHRNIGKSFGKSVASAAHGHLRTLLAYKCRAGGRSFVEVPSRRSTRTCSACLALTGPTGWRGLSVRFWTCSACGRTHDRDTNAALNTLRIGRGLRLEMVGNDQSETAFRCNTADYQLAPLTELPSPSPSPTPEAPG